MIFSSIENCFFRFIFHRGGKDVCSSIFQYVYGQLRANTDPKTNPSTFFASGIRMSSQETGPMTWTHSNTFLKLPITTLPITSLKSSTDYSAGNLLDTTVFFTPPLAQKQKTLHTKEFFKPTDTHSSLHKTSYQPKHTFRGTIRPQCVRFYSICLLETRSSQVIQEIPTLCEGRDPSTTISMFGGADSKGVMP